MGWLMRRVGILSTSICLAKLMSRWPFGADGYAKSAFCPLEKQWERETTAPRAEAMPWTLSLCFTSLLCWGLACKSERHHFKSKH